MSSDTSRMAPEIERVAMERALRCAQEGHPSPAPRVGVVVLHEGALVAEASQAHGAVDAMALALRRAGEAACGATVFTTLAPRGDGLAVQAAVEAGVRRIVYAVPHPARDDAGEYAALIQQGVDVQRGFHGALQQACERLTAPWARLVRDGRAHVTLKAATTLDGRVATRTGESRWITGPEARADVHRLRDACDAVMVGSRTVQADDPALTVRHVATTRQPLRVVVDSALVMSPTSLLARTAREVGVCVMTRDPPDDERAAALRAAGVDVVPCGDGAGRVSLAKALRLLAARGVVSVLCEGGGALHGHLLDEGLADRVVCYVAPMLFGGNDAVPAFGGRGVASLADARRLRDVTVTRVGDDLRVEGEL